MKILVGFVSLNFHVGPNKTLDRDHRDKRQKPKQLIASMKETAQ